MTAEKKQNKSYYVTLKSIVTEEVFPLLFDQGWDRTPFANGAFGTFSQGWIWTLYKFDGTAAQSLTVYLTRHWSGYDAHPNLQIEYRLKRFDLNLRHIWPGVDVELSRVKARPRVGV